MCSCDVQRQDDVNPTGSGGCTGSGICLVFSRARADRRPSTEASEE